MWIDFPPNPSIITGISWKPTSRRRLRALGSSDRSGVSPSHSKYLFFFWRGAAQLWGHFMCQSLRSHSGTTSKPVLALLSSLTWLLDPKNAQTEKCDVGQITAVVLLKKKVEFFCWKHTSPGYTLTSAFVLPVLFKHPGKVGKVGEKKAAVIRVWQKINAWVCHFFVGSPPPLFFLFFMKLFSGTICQMAHSLSYTFDLTGDFIRVRFEAIPSPCARSLTPAVV